jgi:hypothetical protein
VQVLISVLGELEESLYSSELYTKSMTVMRAVLVSSCVVSLGDLSSVISSLTGDCIVFNGTRHIKQIA